MLLSHKELKILVGQGVVRNVEECQIQGSSIDLRLGQTLLIEKNPHLDKHGKKNLKKFLKKEGQYVYNHRTGYSETKDDNRGKFPEYTLAKVYCIDIGKGQALNLEPYQLKKEGDNDLLYDDPYVMRPNEFLLGHTIEEFHLPDNVSAQYHLRSSLGRVGLEHLNAGWCDPGWHDSVLTLELKNITQYHYLKLTMGCPIGQLTFHQHSRVPRNKSYRTTGRYNQDKSVSPSKEK